MKKLFHSYTRNAGRFFFLPLVAAIGLAITTGCPSKATGQNDGDKVNQDAGTKAPATEAGGNKAAAALPPLKPRPNYMIGRAIFEDGRPIPEFEVGFEGGFGGGSKGDGHNGQYAVKNEDAASIIVRNAEAKIHIAYRGKTYLLPLAPADDKTDNQSQEEWRGDIQKGAVRDFVFKLTGIQPGHKVVDPAAVADSDAFDVKNGFWGRTITVYLETDVAQVGNAVEITLTPDGPLIDGSKGKTITRTLHLKQPGSYYYLYDLPLGTYTTTARLVAAGGAATPLRLKEQVIEDPQPSGDTPQDSVKITWTFDDHYQFINNPTLSVSR